ncbi:MAG: radical SAM protein [Candidatus Omnitrophota bacterium]|nr:MAG: radical SAM protein [Candidatus Omnitrophota bacterium]
MRFKRVILVNPYYSNSIFTMPVLPTGLGYIAEVLKKNKIDYRVVDLMLGHRPHFLRKQIYDFRPDLVAFSMMSFMYKDIYGMIGKVKDEFSDVKTLVGGPHISSCGGSVLEECEAIDFGITQEGEETIEDLCRQTDFPDIKSLIYRDNGTIKVTEPRKPIEDLDSLAFPRYENFELNKYGFGIGIVSSRGCPYKCIFCSAHAIRKEYRTRSPKNVVDEMEYWYKKGYREFDLQEDNPTFNKARAFELCDEIERRRLRDLVIMCGNGVRADRVDRKLLTRMKEVGFKRLAFGVEAGNNKVLASLKKGEKIEAIKEAIQTACELGFFVSIFFVVGSPSETVKDVEDSIDIALSYAVSNVSFYNLIPFPGTELFNWVEKNNYFITPPELYLNQGGRIQMGTTPVFETPEFPAEERRRLLKKTKSIERHIKKNIINKKLIKLYPLNKLIAWICSLQLLKYMEDKLTHYEIFRRTIGAIRTKIRLFFYKT